MSGDLAGHTVYVVSYGVQIEGDGWGIDPDLGRVGVFSTEAKAKVYMKKLAYELYWREMTGYELEGPEEEYQEPPSSDDEFNRYYSEEDKIIKFATDSLGDDDDGGPRSGFVKYEKMHIDNIVRAPEETSNKKRKA